MNSALHLSLLLLLPSLLVLHLSDIIDAWTGPSGGRLPLAAVLPKRLLAPLSLSPLCMLTSRPCHSYFSFNITCSQRNSLHFSLSLHFSTKSFASAEPNLQACRCQRIWQAGLSHSQKFARNENHWAASRWRFIPPFPGRARFSLRFALLASSFSSLLSPLPSARLAFAWFAAWRSIKNWRG